MFDHRQADFRGHRFALWVGCTALTFTFPFLKDGLGAHGAFWLYAAICGMGLLYIFTHLPETRGKSLEDIERYFGNVTDLDTALAMLSENGNA